MAKAYITASVYGINVDTVLENEDMALRLGDSQRDTPFTAPLAERSTLEYALPYVKIIASTYGTYGLLEGILSPGIFPPGPNEAPTLGEAPRTAPTRDDMATATIPAGAPAPSATETEDTHPSAWSAGRVARRALGATDAETEAEAEAEDTHVAAPSAAPVGATAPGSAGTVLKTFAGAAPGPTHTRTDGHDHRESPTEGMLSFASAAAPHTQTDRHHNRVSPTEVALSGASAADLEPRLFNLWTEVFGVSDEIQGVEALTRVNGGLGELVTHHMDCMNANGSVWGASTAYVVTFKGKPGKVGLFWRGTEALSLRSYAQTLCWWQVELLPENGGPCPPGGQDEPCLVVSGSQQQFAQLRPDILPAWKRLSGSDTPPTEVIVGGHSVGGAVAQICALWAKKTWPSANVAVVNIASLLVGNVPFAAYIRDTLGAAPLDFSYNNDIFADQLPLNYPLQLWARSSTIIYIDVHDNRITCYASPRPPGVYINIVDHGPWNYVWGIESCIVDNQLHLQA